MNTFDELYQRWIDARNKVETASIEERKLNTELEFERKNLIIPCKCGHESRVGDIELIKEFIDGYFSCSADEWIYHVAAYYVCAGCTEVLMAPEDDQQHFPSGFESYVKLVHEWYSTSQRMSKRVEELLTPHLSRKNKIRQERERTEKLDAARKLLQEAGELL